MTQWNEARTVDAMCQVITFHDVQKNQSIYSDNLIAFIFETQKKQCKHLYIILILKIW